MKTLIELYDERPIENVLGTEVFRPRETIMICPAEVAQNQTIRRSLERYFKLRGCDVKLTFVPVSLLDARSVGRTIRQILESREDCVIDISGGTDAALFAAGAVAGDTPVITYSHKKNTFYEISNAPFARALKCGVRLSVETCFLMAGGQLQSGREDNMRLRERLEDIEQLFWVYSRHRKIWNKQISYIQRISSSAEGNLAASGGRTVKADSRHVTGDAEMLQDLANAGLILDLSLTEERVSFRFPDEMTRFWLRDVGSALEVYVYRACILAGCFDDVVLSAVVNWDEGQKKRDRVSNEIDVVAVSGVHPVFISCKSCEIRTEALNELAVLRDRFGGKDSRAIIVTSAPSVRDRRAMQMRAAELSIEVIDWGDLEISRLIARLKMMN